MPTKLIGITRLPYFPELELLFPSGDFTIVQLLSALLYWNSRDPKNPFNSRQHLVQLSRSLRREPTLLQSLLDELVEIGFLQRKNVAFNTKSNDPQKKIKYDIFYTVDLKVLRAALQHAGLNVPIKILRLAADDSFDLWSYLSPRRLPLLQGLVGMIKGNEYEDAAFAIAQILTGICAQEHYETFSHQALAPGWRMLVQPPATTQDIASRYLAQGERAIDVDLTDGSFFLPDGDYFGTLDHHIWHTGKKKEPRILAASLYLGVATCSPGLKFYSDLSESELKPALELTEDLTGLKPRLGDYYFQYQSESPKNAELTSSPC